MGFLDTKLPLIHLGCRQLLNMTDSFMLLYDIIICSANERPERLKRKGSTPKALTSV